MRKLGSKIALLAGLERANRNHPRLLPEVFRPAPGEVREKFSIRRPFGRCSRPGIDGCEHRPPQHLSCPGIEGSHVDVACPGTQAVEERAASRHPHRQDASQVASNQGRRTLGFSVHDRNHPKVHRAGAIAGEKDSSAVGRPEGNQIVCRVLHQRDFAASIGREHKDVALARASFRPKLS